MGLSSFLKRLFSENNSSINPQFSPQLKLPESLSDFMVIDVETTGLSQNTDEIIQLSAVHFQNGIETESYATYVKPSIHIPPRITEITGIRDFTVRNAPSFETVQEKFFAFINKAPVVTGYNVSFDIRFLSAASEIALFSKWTYFDTLKYVRLCCPELPEYKLGSVCRYINYATDFHNALNDCRACGAVLLYLCETSFDLLNDSLTLHSPSARHTVEKNEFQIAWEKWFLSGYPYWAQGETARKDGRIEDAIQLFDQAKSCEHVFSHLYESYAKIYRKLKDYTREVQILNEGIARIGEKNCEDLIVRKGKALKLLDAQNEAQQEAEEKKRARAERAERKVRAEAAAKSKSPCTPHRAIIQMDDNGIVIKEFPSISAAEKELGINAKSLRLAASGTQKHAGGFCWKFKVVGEQDCELVDQDVMMG